MRHDKPVQAQVAVVYAGRSLFFDLPADTLKADLAILLASFGRGHGKPLAITVTPKLRRLRSRPANRRAPTGFPGAAGR